jgi:hypothetical protein
MAGLVGGVLGLCLLAGCGSHEVVVAPASPGIQDNFFATWEIESTRFGPIECFQAGATGVDMDIVNVDSGERFVDSFACDAYQGTSGPVGVGRFDVLINLVDPTGAVLSQTDLGVSNIETAGTIDLGHVIFTIP